MSDTKLPEAWKQRISKEAEIYAESQMPKEVYEIGAATWARHCLRLREALEEIKCYGHSELCQTMKPVRPSYHCQYEEAEQALAELERDIAGGEMSQKLYRSKDVQVLIEALKLVDPRDSFVFDNDSGDVRDAIQNALEYFAKIKPVSVPDLAFKDPKNDRQQGAFFENERIRKHMEGTK